MNTKEEHIGFLKLKVLTSIKTMQNSGLHELSCVIAGQAIEVLGAYLDNKPMRAKGQSSKRFELAINQLFSGAYTKVNRNNSMYYQLRANFIHMLLPTNKLKIVVGLEQKELHLQTKNGVLHIVAELLLDDLEKAINRLIQLLESDKLKIKKVSSI